MITLITLLNIAHVVFILMITLVIIGDTFLKHYYSVYDMDLKRMGIANPPDVFSLTFLTVISIIAVVVLCISVLTQ